MIKLSGIIFAMIICFFFQVNQAITLKHRLRQEVTMEGRAKLVDGNKYKIKNVNNNDYKLSVNGVDDVRTTLDNIGVSWQLQSAGASDTWYLRNVKHNCRLAMIYSSNPNGSSYGFDCKSTSLSSNFVKWYITGNTKKNRMCIKNVWANRYIEGVVGIGTDSKCNKGTKKWKFVNN